jgi:hypothetical protein
MLPFEVPPTFSNRGFYRFLRKHGVEITGPSVRWMSDTDALDVTMRLLFLNQNRIAYDLKHLLFKYLHDNIIQQIEKNVMTRYREVENLYLLVSLSQIGKEYWLPEAALVKHFAIDMNKNGGYFRTEFLNHFSITVLLSYIKSKVRYKKLRAFLEDHIIAKFIYMKAHCPHDAEGLILLFDLVVCPYVSDQKKAEVGNIFGLDAAALTLLQASNDQWFTTWGDKFDIGKELDAKRSREVY